MLRCLFRSVSVEYFHVHSSRLYSRIIRACIHSRILRDCIQSVCSFIWPMHYAPFTCLNILTTKLLHAHWFWAEQTVETYDAMFQMAKKTETFKRYTV